MFSIITFAALTSAFSRGLAFLPGVGIKFLTPLAGAGCGAGAGVGAGAGAGAGVLAAGAGGDGAGGDGAGGAGGGSGGGAATTPPMGGAVPRANVF